MRFFPFVLIVYPLLELAVLIKFGSMFGVTLTFFLIFISIAVGIYILKKVGFQTSSEIRRSLQLGQPPEKNIVNGFLSAIGAILLIIPGFLSDVIAVVFLVPFLRNIGFKIFNICLKNKSGNRKSNHTRNGIIEGEFEKTSDEKDSLLK